MAAGERVLNLHQILAHYYYRIGVALVGARGKVLLAFADKILYKRSRVSNEYTKRGAIVQIQSRPISGHPWGGKAVWEPFARHFNASLAKMENCVDVAVVVLTLFFWSNSHIFL